MFGGEASIQVFDTDAAVPAGVQTASLVAHRPTPPVNPRSAPAHDRYAPRRPPLPLANSLHLPGPDSPSYVNRRRMSPEAPKETRSRTVSPGAMDAASLSFSHHETPMYITHTHTHTHTLMHTHMHLCTQGLSQEGHHLVAVTARVHEAAETKINGFHASLFTA